MKVQIMTDKQAVEKIIEESCDFSNAVGMSEEHQQQFVQGLKDDPYHIYMALEYLEGRMDRMPVIRFLC